MNSCLIETINNAIVRFAQLEVCEMKAIEQNDGPTIVYIKCPSSRKPQIEKYFTILEAMSSSANNTEKTQIIEMEVSQAVKISARLVMSKL